MVLVLLLPAVCLAQPKLVRKTISIEVVAATDGDSDAAGQIRKMAVETCENYRNLLARRYLADKDLKAQDELQQVVTDANRKVQTGMRSQVFDEGFNELNSAYVRAKGLLGELDPAVVASIYRGLFMGQVTMGDRQLSLEYMLVLRNLQPDLTRQALSYTEAFSKVFDESEEARKAATARKVTITASPAGALIGVDGKTWGKSPLTVDLSAGGHLVQVEMDGYYRGGWIRDFELHSTSWALELKPIESRERYLATLEKLRQLYGPAPAAPSKAPRKSKIVEPPPDPEALLASLHTLLGSDYTLFAVVSGSGASITVNGGFVTSLGVVPVSFTAARDVKIIDSVRKMILDGTDVEKQKTEHAAAAKAQAEKELSGGLAALAGEMETGRAELMVRSRKWAALGEAAKAELFATTAADVSVMRVKLEDVEGSAATDRVKAGGELSRLKQEWEPLHTKVTSLLSWDVEGAIKARQVAQARALSDRARARMDVVRKLAQDKKAALDARESKEHAKVFKDADRWLADAAKKMKKDPLSSEARVVFYRSLILAAELERKLSQKP